MKLDSDNLKSLLSLPVAAHLFQAHSVTGVQNCLCGFGSSVTRNRNLAYETGGERNGSLANESMTLYADERGA